MSERALYERLRRKTIATETRKYKVLSPWLRKLHPEVSQEFDVFFANLERDNPRSKNLVTMDDFKRFFAFRKRYAIVFFCVFLLLLLL